MTAVGHRVTALGRASGSGSGERDEQETGIEGEGGVDAERAFAAFHARWTIDNALGKDASSLPRQEPRRAGPHPDCHSTVALQSKSGMDVSGNPD